MLKFYNVICLVLILFSMQLSAFADKIYMYDGRIFNDIKDLRDLDGYFIFKINNKSYSINKSRIKKIIGSSNNVVYENINLTIEIRKGSDLKEYLVFYKNRIKLGDGAWNSKGEFELISGGPIIDGEYKQFYDSGKLKKTMFFKNGKMNGDSKVYYKSGKIEREGVFKNNKEVGISKIYYNTGTLKGVSDYVNGLKNGETKLYYKSGKLKALMNFVNNDPEGLQKMFYESGGLETVVYFKNGLKNGEVKQYYEGGRLKMKGQLSNGKLDGLLTTYYESGRVKKKNYFNNGRILKQK